MNTLGSSGFHVKIRVEVLNNLKIIVWKMVLGCLAQDDEMFFDYWGENMDLWQNFLLLVRSIDTFCVKLGQFVQI
jgi:hypothetical protein